MAKSEGIGHSVKVGNIEDLGQSFCSQFFLHPSDRLKDSGSRIELATKFRRTLRACARARACARLPL